MSEMEARSPAADETHGASKFDGLGRHVVSRTSLSQNFGQAIRAELIGSNSCSALGITARGHAPVLALCQLLIEAGHDPNRPLLAYRGDTLCLRVRSIVEGAALAVEDDRLGTPHFRRRRARGAGAAPYVAQIRKATPRHQIANGRGCAITSPTTCVCGRSHDPAARQPAMPSRAALPTISASSRHLTLTRVMSPRALPPGSPATAAITRLTHLLCAMSISRDSIFSAGDHP